MQTIVKLSGGMQSNYWGDIPRVSAPLVTATHSLEEELLQQRHGVALSPDLPARSRISLSVPEGSVFFATFTKPKSQNLASLQFSVQ